MRRLSLMLLISLALAGVMLLAVPVQSSAAATPGLPEATAGVIYDASDAANATTTVLSAYQAFLPVPPSTGDAGHVYDSPRYRYATNTARSGVRWLDDIRPDRLRHIQDRHLRGGTLWDESTSYFNNADEIEALVTDAADWTPIIQSNGNLATVVDAGRPIGWDVATGAQTNLYTVIIRPGEGVWTAHPGLPRVGS